MAFRFPNPSQGEDFKPVPEGTWLAVCYGIVDLGTQRTTFKGDPKDVHQIRIMWEIHDEECVMQDGPKKGQPMMIGQVYTLSMSEKANLRKMLEAWRLKKYTDAEIANFNPRNLIGQPCLIGVTHTEKNDKVYANLVSVAKPSKGTIAPEMVNEPLYVVLDEEDFDREAFEKLTDYWKGKIQDSPEYQRIVHGGKGPKARAPMDAEIPF